MIGALENFVNENELSVILVRSYENRADRLTRDPHYTLNAVLIIMRKIIQCE